MKALPLFILLIFFQIPIFGQINYSFSSHSNSFVLLSGDTAVNLTAAYSPVKTVLDEGFGNQVPIGFNFYYNGKIYTFIHLNTNGFASMGAPFLQSNTDPQYEVNELRNPVAYKGSIRPIIAPFWDDLQLSVSADLTYKTEGNSPNRIFIAQWKNITWQNGGAAAISFQLKLFETSNIISFHYSPGAGNIGGGAGASIGITSVKNSMPDFEIDLPYFLSLNSGSNTAMALDSVETDNINTKPINNQEFRFTPIPCAPPTQIHLINYNAGSATLSWIGKGVATNYETALSNIDVLPITSSVISTTNQSFSNLASSNTVYYFFIKEACGNNWTKFTFKTSALASLPYTQGFEASLDNSLPDDLTTQSNSNDFADMHWQATDLLNASAGTKKAVNSSRFAKADSWLYTSSFPLQVGGIYQLGFKYSRTPASNIGLPGTPTLKLLVKYGFRSGPTGMVDTIVFLNNITNTSYLTHTMQFSPPASGQYNIGFGFQADVSDAIILLDDISLAVVSVPLPLHLLAFDAKLNLSEEVDLTWQTTQEQNVAYFELERSTDGVSFTTFGKTFANNHGPDSKNNYEYTDRKPIKGHNYYRLKMVDLDGKFEYSPIRLVDISQNIVTLLYPNPSGNEVYLRIPAVGQAKIRIYNLEGKLLMANIVNMDDNECKISLKDAVPQNIYLVTISTGTETRILKWMVR